MACFLNYYPVTYSFIGCFFVFTAEKNLTWNLSQN